MTCLPAEDGRVHDRIWASGKAVAMEMVGGVEWSRVGKKIQSRLACRHRLHLGRVSSHFRWRFRQVRLMDVNVTTII